MVIQTCLVLPLNCTDSSSTAVVRGMRKDDLCMSISCSSPFFTPNASQLVISQANRDLFLQRIIHLIFASL